MSRLAKHIVACVVSFTMFGIAGCVVDEPVDESSEAVDDIQEALLTRTHLVDEPSEAVDDTQENLLTRTCVGGAGTTCTCSGGIDYSTNTTYSVKYQQGPNSTSTGFPSLPTSPVAVVGTPVDMTSVCVNKVNALRQSVGLTSFPVVPNKTDLNALTCCTANDNKIAASSGHHNTCGFSGYSSWAQGISQTIPYAENAQPTVKAATETMVTGLFNEYPNGHGDVMRQNVTVALRCSTVARRFSDGTVREYLVMNYWQ